MDNTWYEDDSELNGDEYIFTEYDINSSPNDFNIKTIFDFMESGVVKIPGFQRNYVWDIKRASKLIESIIIGLPIPQVFLYEQSRNSFLVIDGQQRLMSIYYFIKKRFPKKEKRTQLRYIFDQKGKIPDEILYNDNFFEPFNLKLPESLPKKPNKLNKLNYSTLGDYKSIFDLRTIRNIIIKQNQPEGDNSSIYEIFNRLNSGGLNLKPQEIRVSLYHSNFYEMLNRLNIDHRWRNLIDQPNPDPHMKDIEILLRSFAMLLEHQNYKPSMTKFLNEFSRKSKSMNQEAISYFENLFKSFLENCSELEPKIFFTKSGKFNISMFEAVFTGICKTYLDSSKLVTKKINKKKVQELKNDSEFITATQSSTASKENVNTRINLALALLN